MGKINIRRMIKNDILPLAKAYSETYAAFDVGERWDTKSSMKLFSYWLERQPDLCFVAEIDKRPVGSFMAGIKPWWDGNHLIDGEVFVHPDHQRKGIGSLLSKKMYREALRKYKVVAFDACTFRKAKFPLSWYKAQGFREIDEWVLITADLNDVMKRMK